MFLCKWEMKWSKGSISVDFVQGNLLKSIFHQWNIYHPWITLDTHHFNFC